MVVVALLACPAPEPATVVIDGPAEVRVDAFGPVDLPPVSVQRGDAVVEGAAVTWSVDPEAVATVGERHLDVRGPGRATVTASFEDARAAYALVVEPPITLAITEPPAVLAVGATVQLATSARLGGAPALVEATPTFASSNDAFATVTPTGAVTGVAPGLVYVTARLGTAEAMVELEVR